MNTSIPKQPLQAAEPTVLVLGDGIFDWLIYDQRTEDEGKSLPWTSPLSRDDWHYAKGFETFQCVAGAAAIHAMLWANDIAVAGNAFQNDGRSDKPSEMGSTFVLRKRANAGKDEKGKTRGYLTPKSFGLGPTWQNVATDEEYADVSIGRQETWRAAVSLLNERRVQYVDEFKGANHVHKADALKAVCLWDVERGFFRVRDTSAQATLEWKAQQNDLLGWYRSLCSETRKPPIIIRTSDPNRFKCFLQKLASEQDGPTVVLVCALTQLDHGDLEGSGTWSDAWAQIYDYLGAHSYLLSSKTEDWRFHVVVPIYEDGVLWDWAKPLADRDRRSNGKIPARRQAASWKAVCGPWSAARPFGVRRT